MIRYNCDGCGAELPKERLRYTVKIDVRACQDDLEFSLMDLIRDHRAEMIELIERLRHKDPVEIEESVYKSFQLDLCPLCQRAFIRDPLHFHPEQGVQDSEINIEEFLRSIQHRSSSDEG